jgi:hypothetical protein
MCVRERRWGMGKTPAMARARLGFSAMKIRMEASFAARATRADGKRWQWKKERTKRRN